MWHGICLRRSGGSHCSALGARALPVHKVVVSMKRGLGLRVLGPQKAAILVMGTPKRYTYFLEKSRYLYEGMTRIAESNAPLFKSGALD